MDLALIGNCSYQALIDKRARVAWLCWPRFDSSFVFGEIVAGERGGEFSIAPYEAEFTSTQSYLPNTNVLQTLFHSPSGEFEVIDFAPRFLQYERPFKPNMLVRMIRRRKGTPRIRTVCRPVYDYGRTEPGYYTGSNHIQWQLPNAQLRLTTNAALTYITEGRPFVLDKDIYLVLTWGQPMEADLSETCLSFFERTRRYWETWVKHAGIPAHFQDEVIRSALVLKLHQYEDTGAITVSTTTSLPEHAGTTHTRDYRYCWLRNSCFTIGALRRLGHFEEMEHFIAYLHNIADSSPESLQPVYSISGESELGESTLDHLPGLHGAPVRIGDDAYKEVRYDMYGEMIAALAPVFLDVRFREHAGMRSTQLLKTLLSHIANHMDMSPTNAHAGERSSHETFSLLMHWTGGTAAERIGERCGDNDLARWGAELAGRARQLIEKRAWNPRRGYYAGSLSSDTADGSLLMMLNLGFLRASHPHAESHVKSLAAALRANDHLVYPARSHDDSDRNPTASPACGFWYAEALARLNHRNEAERVFSSHLRYANHVGLFSEAIDPQTGERWGNMPQTYAHVGIINAAFVLSPISGPLI